jgi:TolB protein
LACGFVFLGVLGLGALRLLATPRAPTPDFAATLRSLLQTPPASPTVGGTTAAPPAENPAGHIVLTCQLYRVQSSEQICIMNADGSGYRRLTLDDGYRHYYPSLSPDGRAVVYSQYRQDNIYEIYELSLADGIARRLTDRLGALTGPAISPDGRFVAFMRWTLASDQDQLWVMERDGSQPRRVVDGTGWDPTWSPDGTTLLFASDRAGSVQLYTVNLDGSGLSRISNLPAVRGRNDWSSQGLITTYSGEPGKRELFLMNADGSQVHQVSPGGGNSQGPSFSPDGRWIAFTAYFDHPNDINGCEIYIIRVDGTDLRRLTDNDYCDYQPRWGP